MLPPAAPPAPAIIALSPRSFADLAYSLIRSGVRWAETTRHSWGTPRAFRMSAASFMVLQSERLPMTMPTSGLVVSGVGLVIVYHWLEKKKAGRKHIPPGLLDRNYFESPIVLGAGAGWALLAQAPRPRAKAAKATATINIANVMVGFSPPFLACCRR